MTPFCTIRSASETELVINKSRFIGRCFPLENEAEATETLERVRKRHWDATHNCYAWRIGADGRQTRSSDDGEPSGTAGMPILGVLTQTDVTNVLCVVTRYFGGVLLGAGGLVRAYSSSASAALKQAGIVEMRPSVLYALELPYADWAAMESMLRRDAQLDDVQYTDRVSVRCWVGAPDGDAFCRRVLDRTDGRVHPAACGEGMRPADECKF